MTHELTPAIVQDADTRQVLMMAWMNDEALRLTEETGYVHFWSRSRQQLWKKGETSGNLLRLVDIRPDCDDDTLLVLARPTGPACHTGADTCWNQRNDVGFAQLESLWSTIDQRATDLPAGSYTTRLIDEGPDLPVRKVTEEAVEVLMAVKDHASGDADDQRVAEEVADLLYHLLVVVRERNIDPALVLDELRRRRR